MDEELAAITELMDHLVSDQPLKLASLRQLSDLAGTEREIFAARWPELKELKRTEIARYLAELCQDNFSVDFGAAFCEMMVDDAANVRIAALHGLWDSEDVSLIETIVSLALRDSDALVRVAAAEALEHYVIMSEWGMLSPDVSPQIVRALAPLLIDETTAVALRAAALEAVSASGDVRVPGWIESAYSEADVSLQISALAAMGNHADKRWLPIILDEMENPNADMRANAALAAGAIGSGEAIPALAELVWDEELEVRVEAVTGLGKIGGEEARRILESLADDSEAGELEVAIDEALEELDLVSGDFDFDMFGLDDDVISDDS